jgi:lipopolysaccharide transport system permease protein
MSEAVASPVIEITPVSHGGRSWRDLWEFRELLYFLVWRDLRVRYRQTVLGAAWAVIQPFATMVVFSLFFGRLAGVPSDGVPYPVFSYAALVPWTYFAGATTQAAGSLVGSRPLLSKVYFPRLVVPIASIVTPLVDAVIALAMLSVVMAWFGVVPSPQVLWLPGFVLMAVASSAAAGIWLAALNVKYRDVRFVVPFLVQFGLFVTPVAYPASLVPEPWRWLYALNPMATVVEGCRWSLVGTPPPSPAMILASALAVAAGLWWGVAYFRRAERVFADVL